MSEIWSKDKEMCSMMFELLKQRACKNAKKLEICVGDYIDYISGIVTQETNEDKKIKF